MKYRRAVTLGKVFIVEGDVVQHVIAIYCPDCKRKLRYLECGLMHCPGCDTYFKVGVCKVEIQG